MRGRVWAVWSAQLRPAFDIPLVVDFTILEDGSLGEIEVLDSGGVVLLDLAARRAITSAAPFAPLPSALGKKELRIRAIFRAER